MQEFVERFGLRRADARDAARSFFTLAGVMAAHATLETARDVLFLAELPASQLPWAYLAIAALAVLAARANHTLLRRIDKRVLLGFSIAAAGVITFGFWLFGAASSAGLIALYVWTGLVPTVVVVQFWLLMGDTFTVAQAKRIFPVVAAGGLIGATTGSFLAERLVSTVPARHTLIAASTLLVITGLFAAFGLRDCGTREPAIEPKRRRDESNTVDLLRSQPYLRRLLALVLLSTIALTGVDYLFKSIAAANVDPAHLDTFLARFYVVLNVAALALQLGLSSRLLRAVGVNQALLILPSLLLLGLFGVAVGAGLMSVIVLKGADGTLRHSLHRTASEVLYIPLPAQIRERFKSLIDGVAQRGGQAIASLGILGAVAVGAGPRALAVAIGAIVIVWLAAAVEIKKYYLELFRGNLREGTIDTRVHLSELDLHSLEVLVAALSSEHDEEVLTALDLFVRHGKPHLVPGLILYHPSKPIVLRAFEAFSDVARRDVATIAHRLAKDEDPDVRAAAIRAVAANTNEHELLDAALSDPSPVVHATALVLRAARDEAGVEAHYDHLVDHIRHADSETRRALAVAIRYQSDVRFRDALVLLAEAQEPEVLVEVARAMAVLADERFMPALLRMLTFGNVRAPARQAFLAIGPRALTHLAQALEDETLPRNVRRHVPRSISRFESSEAASVLMRYLGQENGDGLLRFKALRGLGRLKADHPEIRLDRAVLTKLARGAIERSVQMLDWRIVTEQDQARDEHLRTLGGELLCATLREKEANALARAFRYLSLLHPDEDFALLYQGLRRNDQHARAVSRELLEYVLDGDIRAAVLALVDEADEKERLVRARAALGITGPPPSYEVRLVRMLESGSEAVQSVAAYHIAELGLVTLEERLRAVHTEPRSFLRDVIDRALTMLQTPPLTGRSHAV